VRRKEVRSGTGIGARCWQKEWVFEVYVTDVGVKDTIVVARDGVCFVYTMAVFDGAGFRNGFERLFQVDLRLCGIREWVSVHGMGWGGGEEGRIKLNPLIFFPFGVHIKEGYHVGIYWLVRLHHISLIPYRDEQKRNRGTNAENGKDEWPSLHRLPPFLLCK